MANLLSTRTYKYLFHATLLIVTILFLMPVPQAADSLVNDKLIHALVFFGLSFLFDRAYVGLNSLIYLVPALISYGLLIEVLQGFSGYRMFSLADLIADLVGILVYLLICLPMINVMIKKNH